MFTLLKSLLRPFVSSEPLEKIVVHSSPCVESMSRCIDIAHIPHSMGGHCRCGRGGGDECLKHFDEARILGPCLVPAALDTASDAPLVVVETKHAVAETKPLDAAHVSVPDALDIEEVTM